MAVFDDAIRGAIATLHQRTSDGGLQVSVTHRPYLQQDTFGDAEPYGTPVTRTGIYVDKKMNFHAANGEEIQTQSRITFLGNIAMTANDQITLPDGTSPPILEVKGFRDPAGGRFLTTVVFGQSIIRGGA